MRARALVRLRKIDLDLLWTALLCSFVVVAFMYVCMSCFAIQYVCACESLRDWFVNVYIHSLFFFVRTKVVMP